MHLEGEQTAAIQFLLFHFSESHLQYSNNYLQGMIAGLTGNVSQNDFQGLFRFSPDFYIFTKNSSKML